jgi:hypothetical protein
MLHDCLVGIIPRAEVPSLAKQMMHGSWKLPTTNSRSENLSLLSLVLYSSFLIGPSAISPGGLFVNRKTRNRPSKNASHLEKGLSPKIRPSFLLDFKKKNKSGLTVCYKRNSLQIHSPGLTFSVGPVGGGRGGVIYCM